MSKEGQNSKREWTDGRTSRCAPRRSGFVHSSFLRHSSFDLRHSRWASLLAFATLTLAGCAGYHVGNRTLYAPDVQTVSLQMFGSDSFRRGLGEWLTEAVGKEIENRTPYKIVRSTEADSTISGRLLAETKRGTVETINDDLRELNVALYVQFEWRKHDGELIRQGQPIPLSGILRDTYAHNSLVPEVGQTMVTAQQRAIEQLAQQIVDQMEAPW